EGASLSASLSAGHGGRSVIPPVVVHMIGIGEKSGELGPMLVAAADTYEKELEAGIKATLGMLEPLLIVVMGVVVGFIVLAILLPLFELNQVVT
ncbi:MAG TPA: type II secretion system protein GspF, partial [Deltaproteobacteria bacterium]|nr:type II secretion system protein GspF [Deltaproteobacteria bacterium]